MIPNFAIRLENKDDAIRIRDVTQLAFADAAHRSGTEPAIIDALRAAGALTLSLVAVNGDALIGHAAFSPVHINAVDENWFGLGPVSVLPGFQRQGIGAALISDGLRRLRAQGAQGCVVLGDPAYYSRFGFSVTPALTFPEAPPEYFMALSFGDSTAAGVVSYHSSFYAS